MSQEEKENIIDEQESDNKQENDVSENEDIISEDQQVQPEEEPKEETVLKSDMDALEKKFGELNDSYLRLYADFDNYKKRTAKEKTETALYATALVMQKLLPVIDNFERALAAETEESAFYTGVKMVYKQLDEILVSEGLKAIPAEGELFDPNLHHAVMTESDEAKDDNVITEQLQRGYMYKEKVLRPAMVKVNKK